MLTAQDIKKILICTFRCILAYSSHCLKEWDSRRFSLTCIGIAMSLQSGWYIYLKIAVCSFAKASA